MIQCMIQKMMKMTLIWGTLYKLSSNGNGFRKVDDGFKCVPQEFSYLINNRITFRPPKPSSSALKEEVQKAVEKYFVEEDENELFNWLKTRIRQCFIMS